MRSRESNDSEKSVYRIKLVLYMPFEPGYIFLCLKPLLLT